MAAPAASAAAASSAAEQALFLQGAPVSSLSARAQALLADTRALFGSTFGSDVADSSLSIGVAPGRVNLIGEHTDYNEGFVMPLAIDRHTVVLGRRNGLQVFRIISANANERRKPGMRMPRDEEDEDEEDGEEGDVAMDSAPAESEAAAEDDAPVAPPALVELDLAAMVAKYAGPIWHNYFRGVVAQFIAAGHAVPFFDVAIGGNVPLGGGLSSSASLEVATAAFLQALLQLPLDAITRALWCQKCEHDYCNCPCGVMDQFVASLAKKDHVMLLDCRSLVSVRSCCRLPYIHAVPQCARWCVCEMQTRGRIGSDHVDCVCWSLSLLFRLFVCLLVCAATNHGELQRSQGCSPHHQSDRQTNRQHTVRREDVTAQRCAKRTVYPSSPTIACAV